VALNLARKASAITAYVPNSSFRPQMVTYYYDGGKPGGELTSDLIGDTDAINFFAQHDVIVWGVYFNDAGQVADSNTFFDQIRAARTALGLPRQKFGNYIEGSRVEHRQLRALYRNGTTGIAWYDYISSETLIASSLVAIAGATDANWNRDYTISSMGTDRGTVAASANLTGLSAAVLGDWASVTGGNRWVLIATPYSTLGNWVDSGKAITDGTFKTALFTTVGSPADETLTRASMMVRGGANFQAWKYIAEAGMLVNKVSAPHSGRASYCQSAFEAFGTIAHSLPNKVHPTLGLRSGHLIAKAHLDTASSGMMLAAGNLDFVMLDDFTTYPVVQATPAANGLADWLGTGSDIAVTDATVRREYLKGWRQFQQDFRQYLPVELCGNALGAFTSTGGAFNSHINLPGARGCLELALSESEFYSAWGYGASEANGYINSTAFKLLAPTRERIQNQRKGTALTNGAHVSARQTVYGASSWVTPDRRLTVSNNQQWEVCKYGLGVTMLHGERAADIPGFFWEGHGRTFNPTDMRIVIDEQKLVFGEPVDGEQLTPKGGSNEPWIFMREFANVLVIVNCHPGGSDYNSGGAYANPAALPSLGGTVATARVTSTGTWYFNYFGWADTGISITNYPTGATLGDMKAYPPAGVWKRITSTHGDTVNDGSVIWAGGLTLTPCRAVFLVKV
jgi:hypothetical protein